MATNNAAQKVFNILGFQYKPLEKAFLKFCKDENRPDMADIYKKASYAKKIAILDHYAAFLGL